MSITSSTLVHSTYGSWMASTMVFTVPGIQVMADMVATNASTAVATGARWASWKATRSPGKASRSPSGPRQRVPPPASGGVDATCSALTAVKCSHRACLLLVAGDR